MNPLIDDDVKQHPALQGLNDQEIKYLRELAKLYVQAIAKMGDEKALELKIETGRKKMPYNSPIN